MQSFLYLVQQQEAANSMHVAGIAYTHALRLAGHIMQTVIAVEHIN